MQIAALSVTQSIHFCDTRANCGIRQVSFFHWKELLVVATADSVRIRVMKQDVLGSLR